MKRFVCRNCGSTNELSRQPMQGTPDRTEGNSLKGFEYKLPSGEIRSVDGLPTYISSLCEHLSIEDYLEKYSINPEIARNSMRQICQSLSSETGSFREPSAKDGHPQSKRSRDWLDEDYWTD